jgi:di/tripeptidase
LIFIKLTNEKYRIFKVFDQSIKDYHINDSIETEIKNPYSNDQFEHLLYQKNWIDTVQWHLEDIIRDPEIEPIGSSEKSKRVIDASNQKRTDLGRIY